MWSRLYQEHFDTVFRHILHLTGDRDLAEDLVQETFAAAMVSLHGFRGDSKLSTWLMGIGLNITRKHWSRRKSARKAHDALVAVADLSPGANDNPEHARLQRTRAEVLYAVLDSFPASLREVFILRELEGLHAAEVAELLGISEGNVNTRASRARARVRKELERLGWLSPRRTSVARKRGAPR
ncbi:MAG: sigma-70 family RNA polymerase sigma factor [Myxococcales bacterium]|nr:sigma-70 family RNA polymerase sigma factor [Myxococcales bacterium]